MQDELKHTTATTPIIRKIIVEDVPTPGKSMREKVVADVVLSVMKPDPALAAAQAEVAALQIENARLRQAIADEANRINIEGSAYHRAQLALDEIVTGLKVRYRAALVQP
jgi:hypothetical protein